MTVINYTCIFTQQITELLEIELQEWMCGEKKFNINNQFDEDILRSAISELNRCENVALKALKFFRKYTPTSTMSIAYHLSTFKAPELDRAWID